MSFANLQKKCALQKFGYLINRRNGKLLKFPLCNTGYFTALKPLISPSKVFKAIKKLRYIHISVLSVFFRLSQYIWTLVIFGFLAKRPNLNNI